MTATLNPTVKTFTERHELARRPTTSRSPRRSTSRVGAPIKQTVAGDVASRSGLLDGDPRQRRAAGRSGRWRPSHRRTRRRSRPASGRARRSARRATSRSRATPSSSPRPTAVVRDRRRSGSGSGPSWRRRRQRQRHDVLHGTLTMARAASPSRANVSTNSNATGRAVGGAILGAVTGPTITARDEADHHDDGSAGRSRRRATSSPSRT